jgi:hypothetical protein
VSSRTDFQQGEGMKYKLSVSFLALGLSFPALAAAQELGRKGDAVFSADRLMGVTGTHVELGPLEEENDWTSLSFGWRASPETSPYDVPRFSFDYLVIDHLTIGGSLGYASIDPERGDDSSAVLLAARIGYLYSFGRVVGIWPRGGFAYHSLSSEPRDESGFGLSLECPFTFSPASHFAFTVGPTFDIDMFGEVDPGPAPAPDYDQKYRAVGVNAGLLGWF